MFDISGFESNRNLQRRSSSLLSIDHPTKTISKQHSGLMSWPEHFHKPNHHHQDHNQEANRLSTRAMQLSIYGSMVDNPRLHGPSPSGRNQVKSFNSRSYPRVPSDNGRILVSVRSEGSNTVQKNLEEKECRRQNLTLQLQNSSTKENPTTHESSDESGGEDEHVVRIDSLSRLSFAHAS